MSPAPLAHLGGAPEALTIALPVLVFGGFLLLERRARRREREAAAHPDAHPEQPDVQPHVPQDEGPAPDRPTS